jgi:precorrin-2/cobalt-factor-2 C20-methyltransferase
LFGAICPILHTENNKQASMHTPVYFVSLGPGDPELITLKGLKILQQANTVFYPATQSKQGEVVSRAVTILRALEIPESVLCPFILPMSKDRSHAQQAYDSVYEEVVKQHDGEKRLVIVAEGDAGFYSSIHYIMDRLNDAGIPSERIAGVPAFIAAGALGGIHVVKQEEKLLVLPGIVTGEELEQYLGSGLTVVIMKLSQCGDVISAFIKGHAGYQYHYFENVGTEKEYYTDKREEITCGRFPYFSLLLIKP